MENDRELDAIRQKKIQEFLGAGNRVQSNVNSQVSPLVLTDGNFSEEIGKNRLIMVDFWAEWCGPCRMVSPVIDELAREYAGKFTFGRLNVDENPYIAGAFQIRSIPTLLIFKDGKVVDGILGAAPKRQIESRILPHLN